MWIEYDGGKKKNTYILSLDELNKTPNFFILSKTHFYIGYKPHSFNSFAFN